MLHEARDGMAHACEFIETIAKVLIGVRVDSASEGKKVREGTSKTQANFSRHHGLRVEQFPALVVWKEL